MSLANLPALPSSVQRAASAAILSQQLHLAEAVVNKEFSDRPDLLERFGQSGRDKSLRDASYHLSYLAEAIRLDSPALFTDYVAWAKVVLASRGVLSDVFAHHLQCMRDVLVGSLPSELSPPACRVVEHALHALPIRSDAPPTYIKPAQRYSRLARQYLEALLRWERPLASRLALEAASKVPIEELYLHVFQRALYELGRMWQLNRISIAQEHYCSSATLFIMSQLRPHIMATDNHGGTMLATAIAGDRHELGVRMVTDVFELCGWNTLYLGADVPTAAVAQAIKDCQPDVLCISATLVCNIQAVEELIAAARRSNPGDRIKVLVGGYAFNLDPKVWRKVGADAYAPDLVMARQLCERLSKVRVIAGRA